MLTHVFMHGLRACVYVCVAYASNSLFLCLCAITFMSSLSVYACVPLFLCFLAPCVFVCPTAFKCVVLFYLYILSIFTYLSVHLFLLSYVESAAHHLKASLISAQ